MTMLYIDFTSLLQFMCIEEFDIANRLTNVLNNIKLTKLLFDIVSLNIYWNQFKELIIFLKLYLLHTYFVEFFDRNFK